MRIIAVTSVCALLLASSTKARGDQVKACVDASSQGQTLRDARKLIEAKAQFQACASGTCPGVVQKDCAMWLDEVQKEIPTIVLAAKDARGADLLKVRVVADGAIVAVTLDGKAVQMNPGAHTFRFELGNGQKVEQQYLVRQGQKNQPVTATFAPEPGSQTAKRSNDSAGTSTTLGGRASTDDTAGGFPWRPVGWVAAGVGVVAIGVGAVFGLQMQAKVSDRDKLCPGSVCASDQDGAQFNQLQSDAHTAATISTVGFVVGGVALASGITMVLAAPSRKPAVGFRLAPWFDANGGGAAMGGRF